MWKTGRICEFHVNEAIRGAKKSCANKLQRHPVFQSLPLFIFAQRPNTSYHMSLSPASSWAKFCVLSQQLSTLCLAFTLCIFLIVLPSVLTSWSTPTSFGDKVQSHLTPHSLLSDVSLCFLSGEKIINKNKQEEREGKRWQIKRLRFYIPYTGSVKRLVWEVHADVSGAYF